MMAGHRTGCVQSGLLGTHPRNNLGTFFWGCVLRVCLVALMLGCTSSSGHKNLFRVEPVDSNILAEGRQATREVGPGHLRFRWIYEGESVRSVQNYVPVARSVPALNPKDDRIYVGTVTGELWVLNSGGGRLKRRVLGSAMDSEILYDATEQALYFGSEDGYLYALDAKTLNTLWRTKVGAAVRKKPLLTNRAVFVVTEQDVVLSIDRNGGAIIWRYAREPVGGLQVAGRAGLAFVNGLVLTAFADGNAVCLKASDGKVIWDFDTSDDVPEPVEGAPAFIDVDTTPTVVADKVYIASAAGGLYAINLRDGTAGWRNPALTGISAITYDPKHELLIFASADHGLFAMREFDKTIVWKTISNFRGLASQPILIGKDSFLVGESRGGLVIRSLSDGKELARIDTGQAEGFSSPPAVMSGRGVAVANTGAVLGFDYQ